MYCVSIFLKKTYFVDKKRNSIVINNHHCKKHEQCVELTLFCWITYGRCTLQRWRESLSRVWATSRRSCSSRFSVLCTVVCTVVCRVDCTVDCTVLYRCMGFGSRSCSSWWCSPAGAKPAGRSTCGWGFLKPNIHLQLMDKTRREN